MRATNVYCYFQPRVILYILTIFIFFIAIKAANAYDPNTNRQIIPLGETEAFLGNAGVGRADDTGAVYYNPAGLSLMSHGRVSVTGSVYYKFDTKTDSAFFLDGTKVGYQITGLNTVPATFVASLRLNSDWVGAFSILVPDSFEQENRSPFTTPNTSSNIVNSVKISDYWFGFSAGKTINKQWSLGASLYGIIHQETSTIGVDLQFPAAPTAALITDLQQLTLNVFGLSAILGTSYMASDQLRIGLRMQTPFIELSGSADTYDAAHVVGAGVVTTTGEDHRSIPANFRMPFDFTLGASLQPERWFTWLADISLQLGSHYTTIPGGSTLSEDVNLTPTVRYNTGVEIMPLDWMPIRTGFFYNPSAVGTKSTDPGTVKENYWGVTLGVGLNSTRVKTGVGAFYVWSTGQIMPAGAAAGSSPGSVASKGYGFVLNTSYIL